VGDLFRIPVERAIDDRTRWLVRFRWILLIAASVAVLALDLALGFVLPYGKLVGLMAVVLVYNVTFWWLVHHPIDKFPRHRYYAALAHAQIGADMLALTALLHLSGGLENPLFALYVLLVGLGSILTSPAVSYGYAAVATGLWIGLTLLEGLYVLPHHNLAGYRLPMRYREWPHLVSVWFAVAASTFGIAYLCSGIMQYLRRGEQELWRATAACEARADELMRLNQQLQELDQSRYLFIRLVTHELRAPVAAIQSYLRLILEGYVPDERLMEIVAKAERRAHEQLELIGDLLDLARVQDVREQPQLEPVDVGAVLRDVLDMMAPRIEGKRLMVDVGVASDLPPVRATEAHIKQVWTNLISNAIKYTPERGQIAVRCGIDDDKIRGTVSDTGIGIHPEELEHVFEDFFRTDAAKAMARHGTGLGLSIVRGVVERYGGEVWVESVVDEGSTFGFTLPLEPDAPRG
jgi:signal transduction histidine kinase